MALKCPACGASIPAKNINMQKTLALCEACEHVFDFSQTGQGRGRKSRKVKPRKVTPPALLEVHDDENQLEIVFRFLPGPGPIFGIVMASIGFMATLMGVLSGLVGMVPLSFLFGYMLAVAFTTTTRLLLDDEVLDVQSGPLPFPFSDNAVLSRQDVKRVYHKETTEVIPFGIPAHHICAELKNGDEIILARSLPRNDAYHIARIVEARLQGDVPGRDNFDENAVADSDFQGNEAVSAARLRQDSQENRDNRESLWSEEANPKRQHFS